MQVLAWWQIRNTKPAKPKRQRHPAVQGTDEAIALWFGEAE